MCKPAPEVTRASKENGLLVYIVEYQFKRNGEWVGHISQVGYTTLEAAQKFVETRPGNPQCVIPMWYEINKFERYLIHDIAVQ